MAAFRSSGIDRRNRRQRRRECRQNAYDEYGQPDSNNQGRFQYTGQAWIPELGLYYYKARFYSPALGRFLQVDPVGYEGGVNLYDYVGDDPINKVDPSGLTCTQNKDNSYDCKVDWIPKGTSQATIDKMNQQYTAAVNRLMSNPNALRSIGTEARIGTRISSSVFVTQRDVGNALISAFVSYAPLQPLSNEGKIDRGIRGQASGVSGDPVRTPMITLFPRAVDPFTAPGNRLGQTFIHEGGHLTPEGAAQQAQYSNLSGNPAYESDHQGPYRRMTQEVWPDENQ